MQNGETMMRGVGIGLEGWLVSQEPSFSDPPFRVTMVVWGLGCVDMDQAFTLLSFFGGARLAQGSCPKL